MLPDRTIDEIHNEMLQQISNTEDTSENSFVHDVLAPGAVEIFGLNRLTESIYNKFDIENLEDDELDRFVQSRTGLERKRATYATAKVIISGLEGTKVREGDLVSSGGVDFAVIADSEIDIHGKTTVTVRAQQPGSIGNVPAETINEFPTTITNLIDVYNPESAINGVDRETDNELRERYYNKLQRPGKAGNAFHYEEWANAVPGVGGARVFPLWDGPLSVKVLVIATDKRAAGPELIGAVNDHIEKVKPFGANLTVGAPSELEINLSATVAKEAGLATEEVEARIKQRIADHLGELAFTRDYISYAQIGSILLGTEGVTDYSDLLINNGQENISIGQSEIAVIGTIKVQ